MIRFALDPDGQTVSVSLTEYLGDRFGAYRDLCSYHGARYVPGQKCNRLSVESVVPLMSALREKGFVVDLDPLIATRLAAEAEEATKLLTQGRARLEAADRLLQGTGRALFPYQRTGVEGLAPRRRALLADAMGTCPQKKPENPPSVLTQTGWIKC